MFTHMKLIKNHPHVARGASYELLVYQIEETSEYRIFIAKGGLGVGDVFTASQDVVQDAAKVSSVDVIDSLLKIAIDDIERNEFGLY